jgi:hypothetical protein
VTAGAAGQRCRLRVGGRVRVGEPERAAGSRA